MTGVQTCALPILLSLERPPPPEGSPRMPCTIQVPRRAAFSCFAWHYSPTETRTNAPSFLGVIGLNIPCPCSFSLCGSSRCIDPGFSVASPLPIRPAFRFGLWPSGPPWARDCIHRSISSNLNLTTFFLLPVRKMICGISPALAMRLIVA